MTLDKATHRTILITILKDIYTDHELGPLLGFKGGTAAYLFYGLDRFSVDLDFDVLNADKEDFIFERLKNILSVYGDLIDVAKKKFSFLYVLSYHNKIDNAFNVKVEVNRRDFGSRYEIKSYLGIPMKIMVREDMFAHKLVAMYERIGKTNRDIFDVFFFLKHHWPLNETIIQKRTGMNLQQFLQLCIDTLEAMSPRGILFGLGELIDAQQKIWVKNNLKNETIFLLKARQQSL